MWRLDKYLRRLDVRRAGLDAVTIAAAGEAAVCVHVVLAAQQARAHSTVPASCTYRGLLHSSPPLLPLLPGAQAALVVADRNQSLQITGNGDVLEPHDGIIAIGSGRCAIQG